MTCGDASLAVGKMPRFQPLVKD